MKSEPLIAKLLDAGVLLSVEDGRLKLDSPQTLPDELLTTLRKCRDDLLEAFIERAAIREFDGGIARADAERLAWQDLRQWMPNAD